jgi:hypothetical protein
MFLPFLVKVYNAFPDADFERNAVISKTCVVFWGCEELELLILRTENVNQADKPSDVLAGTVRLQLANCHVLIAKH